MRFCPDCGTPHECEAQAQAERTEVAIERLRTNRDIEVARITASAASTIAETEAEHSAEHAEGVAEGMETALDAVTGTDEAEAADGEPIVVEASAEPEFEPEGEPENAPPEVVEVAEPDMPKRGGYWDAYR